MRIEQIEKRGQLLPEHLASLDWLVKNDGRSPVVLTDFDHTLCQDYAYDPRTHNHVPAVTPEVISASMGVHMVIATGRRANHPYLSKMWDDNLAKVHTPIIAENGGTLVYASSGKLNFVDLVEHDDFAVLKDYTYSALESLGSLPSGQNLIIKEGRTCMITRLEDDTGVVWPEHQNWLSEKLKLILTGVAVSVVNSRTSVTVQLEGIDKRRAFRTYLNLLGVNRDDICVIGLGDAENDFPIFEEADISIGFSDRVEEYTDLLAPNGVSDVANILNVIRASTLNASGLAPPVL